MPVSGCVLAPVAHLHVGQCRVLDAVWLAGHRLGVTEMELASARLANRPTAGHQAAIRARRWRGDTYWHRRRPGPYRHDGVHQCRQRLGAGQRRGSCLARRCGGTDRRGWPELAPSRRIGEGRAGKSSRCALPTTAFFETPIRRPISAVESAICPQPAQMDNRLPSPTSISWVSWTMRPQNMVVGRFLPAHNRRIRSDHKNLWKTHTIRITRGWIPRRHREGFADVVTAPGGRIRGHGRRAARRKQDAPRWPGSGQSTAPCAKCH